MACLTSKRWNFRSAGSDPVPKPHSNWEPHELTSSHLLITSSVDLSFSSHTFLGSSYPLTSPIYFWLSEVSSYSPMPLSTPPSAVPGLQSALQLLPRSPHLPTGTASWLGMTSSQAGPSAPLRILTVPQLELSPSFFHTCPDLLCLPPPVLHPLSPIPCSFLSQCQLTSYCIGKIVKQLSDCSLSNPFFLTTVLP